MFSVVTAAADGTEAAGVAADAISVKNGIALATIVAVAFLALGGIIAVIRNKSGAGSSQESVIRSWIAVALVLGLLFFCAVSFALEDTGLRNALFGALTASTGAAVAFYFSSKAADTARADILQAMGASNNSGVEEQVPVAGPPGGYQAAPSVDADPEADEVDPGDLPDDDTELADGPDEGEVVDSSVSPDVPR